MRTIKSILFHLFGGNLMPASGDFGNHDGKSFESINHTTLHSEALARRNASRISYSALRSQDIHALEFVALRHKFLLKLADVAFATSCIIRPAEENVNI